MPNSIITCVYQTTVVGGQNLASMIARMAAVPVDLTIPLAYGLRYIGDQTGSAGNVIQRQFTFRMTPTTDAVASTGLEAGSSASPIERTIVSVHGAGYMGPPGVDVVGASNFPARLSPVMDLANDAIVVMSGVGYHVATTKGILTGGGITSNPLDPTDGVQGTVSISLGASGELTGVTVLTNGGPYTTPPTLTLVDTDPNPGHGAVVSMSLALAFLDIIGDGGMGYMTAPSVTIEPMFKIAFPDNSDQQSSVANFMTQAFEKALNSNVLALIPAVS